MKLYRAILKAVRYHKGGKNMALLHSDVLCPYCLQELRSRDLKTFCNICGELVTPTRIELLLKKIPKCKEPECRGFGSVKKCSHCNINLPSDILDYEKYLRFSILGITGSGKTNFLTTMLHELRHTSGSPWVLSPMDANTTAIFQQNDRAIYSMRQPVAATAPGITPPPQLWKIKDKNRMTNTVIPSYSMTIFDGAGEDCEHIDPVISRYIEGSKVLVILLDPLALHGVASSIPQNILNWSISASHYTDASADMVNGLATYIKNNCGIALKKKINKDVAVVFTKIDAVKDTFGSATVMQPSPHLACKGFVKADADAVDAEIRDWLESQGENTFLNEIDTNFIKSRVRFFGVSSFGQPPTGSNQLGKVMPHRVLDPLIWMLSKEGIVPTL